MLKGNPFYHGPRPHLLRRDRLHAEHEPQTSFLQIEKDQADYDLYGTPSTGSQPREELGREPRRFWVHPAMTVNYLAMNTKRAPFTDPKLRQAVNFAVSRSAMLAQAGFKAGNPSDQVLPPTMRGFRNAKFYPLANPDIARAKALIGGKSYTVNLYTTTDDTATRQAQVVQDELGPDRRPRQHQAVRLRRARQQDTGVTSGAVQHRRPGVIADYADPFDFINILLSGDKITKSNNMEASHSSTIRAFNREMRQAVLLAGLKPLSAYGKARSSNVDRIAAPWGVACGFEAPANSSRSNVGCYIFQPILEARWISRTPA